MLELVAPPLELLVAGLCGVLMHLLVLYLLSLSAWGGGSRNRRDPVYRRRSWSSFSYSFGGSVMSSTTVWSLVRSLLTISCPLATGNQLFLLLTSSLLPHLGNLSTEQINVDVSNLLHTEEQILNTDRQPCFMDKVCKWPLTIVINC